MAEQICKRIILWLAVLVLLPAGIARAQISNAGQITGTVLDPSEKVIPGAVVTASQPSTGFSQTVKASASGVYVLADLQPGTYQVEATAPGFAKAVYTSVVVQVAQTTNLEIKMTIGQVSETVTVIAAATVLQTTQNTLGTTISPSLMEDLPLNGRDLTEFAALAPGAANPGLNGNNYTTYNNLPNAALNISIGGTTDQFLRYKTFSSSFWAPAPLREGAFEEATVSTSGLQSSNGAEGASQIQFEVKRGTDQFHGRAFWQAENSFFNANSWFNNAHGYPLPKSRNNWFGGNLGGPLWPHSFLGGRRAYFFANLEYNRVPSAFINQNNTLTSDAAGGLYTYEVSAVPSSPPPWIKSCDATALTCTADLYALAQAYNSANGTNFASATDPTVANLLSSIASYYSKGTLQPLASTSAGLAADDAFYLQQLAWHESATSKNWYGTTRLDMDITSKIHWSDSWDIYWHKYPSLPDWPGSPYVGNWTGFANTYYTWTNDVRWTISPTMINTTSFGIMSDVETYDPGAQPTGFSKYPVDGVPSQIEMPGSFGIPTLIPGVASPVPRNNPLFNPSDTLHWTRGNHSFYIGGNLIYANMREQQWVFPGVPDYTTGIAPGDPAAGMFVLSNFPNMNNSQSPITSLTGQQAAENLYAFLTGRISSVGGGTELNPATGQFQPGYGLIAREAKTYGGLYFQDSWSATPHFTLNYGLRWEFTGAIHNTDNTYFSATRQNLLGPSATLFTPGQLNGIANPYIAVDPHPYNGDFVQPAPNLGFAWNPSYSDGFLGKVFGGSNTVVRASFGINPYDEGWETFENSTIYTGLGYAQYLSYSVAGGMFTPGSETFSTPGLYNNVAATATPPSYQTALPESTYTFKYFNLGGVDPNIKSPYIIQWNFGVQRQLPGSVVLEVDYVGNHAVHEWQSYNLNEINATSNGFLTDFNKAVNNYNINAVKGQQTFADNTGYSGIVPTPVFDAAFSGNGVTTSPSDPSGYGNGYPFIYDLTTGQAGAMAHTLASTYSYLCNMVGANFGPCGHAGGSYPINYFEANPYAEGAQLMYLSDPASSTYNGLQISVRHPTGHGLVLGGSYTFSKSLGSRFLSLWTDTAGENFISLRSPGLDKGPSDYDIRHVFHGYFTYNLPAGRGRALNVNNPILNGVVGGWSVGSIITLQSGIPFWLQGGYGTFNDEDGGVVLNGVTAKQLQDNIGVYITPSSPYAPEWLNPKFNATAKILPNTNPGTIGQMLFLHGPRFFNTDISLNKTFPIHERLSLKVQASFLNAFNHPNWITGYTYYGPAPGNLVYASSSLGEPSATYTGSPRVVQFRTEINF